MVLALHVGRLDACSGLHLRLHIYIFETKKNENKKKKKKTSNDDFLGKQIS